MCSQARTSDHPPPTPQCHLHRFHDCARLEYDADITHLAESDNLIMSLGDLLNLSCLLERYGLGHNPEEHVRPSQA